MLDADDKRDHAQNVLSLCHIERGQNFYTLSSSQVDDLLHHADLERYHKPKNANGSRGRYYHERLQRLAGKG